MIPPLEEVERATIAEPRPEALAPFPHESAALVGGVLAIRRSGVAEPLALEIVQRLVAGMGQPWPAERVERAVAIVYRTFNGEQSEERGGPAQFVSLAEFLEEKDEHEPMLIAGGIVPRAGIVLLSGDGGIGKTSLVVQLAFSLAAGRPFLGFDVPEAAPVLFLEGEGSRANFRARVAVAQASLGASRALPLFFSRKNSAAGLEIESPGLLHAIRATGAALVILDTVSIYGTFEENSATEWKLRVLKPLLAMTAETGCAFLLLDHVGKPADNRPGRYQTRGTSAKVDDVDSALRFVAGKGDPRHDRILHFDKLKTGDEPEPLALWYDREHAIFRPSGQDARTVAEPRLADVVEIVAGGLCATAAILAALKGRHGIERSQAEQLLYRAKAEGLIATAKRGEFSLPPVPPASPIDPRSGNGHILPPVPPAPSIEGRGIGGVATETDSPTNSDPEELLL